MGDDGTPLLHECLKWARKLSNGEIRTALRFLQDELKESRTPPWRSPCARAIGSR